MVRLGRAFVFCNLERTTFLYFRHAGGVTDEKVVADLVQTLDSKLDAYEVILSDSKYLAGDVSKTYSWIQTSSYEPCSNRR